MSVDCFEDFQQRGLVHDVTDEPGVRTLLNGFPATVYCGFDPTADSLHVGSMVPLLQLARLQRHGHRPIALAGGATGRIGDPSGKSEERNLLTAEVLQHNVECVKKQLSAFLEFDDGSSGALLVDNADWLSDVPMLTFLRDVGKHFSVNAMIAKDSVKTRLNTREAGISYTEFSYMLLQAADFQHLHQAYGCTLQVGGSDQWGNITAGMELVRKTEHKSVYGMTFPLITTASGAKLGKTEKGAVWLDPERTSPFQLYQYFMRSDDRDVVAYLKYFTFLNIEEIAHLAHLVETEPHRREAQKTLASEFTALIHGGEAVRSAVAATELLYGGSTDDITESDLLAAAEDMPRTEATELFGTDGRDIIDLVAQSNLVDSRGQAKRALAQGGLYVNNQRWEANSGLVSAEHLLFGRYLLLRLGKRNYDLMVFSS